MDVSLGFFLELHVFGPQFLHSGGILSNIHYRVGSRSCVSVLGNSLVRVRFGWVFCQWVSDLIGGLFTMPKGSNGV